MPTKRLWRRVARYNAQLVSGTALATNTAFAWLGYSATVGFRLRRVTLGVVAGTGAPTSQQVSVGFNPTNAGAISTPVNVTNYKLNRDSAASSCNLISGWTTPPTLGAQSTDQYTVSFNTQSGVDLPWELLEELGNNSAPATNVGIAFVNRQNALPSAHAYTISVEWEE